MNLNTFDYILPKEKIAQTPAEPRDQSKLLICKKNKKIDTTFSDIAEYIPKNSVIVFNNSKVFPAKLTAKNDNNKNISVLLLKKINENTWKAIITPGVKNNKKLFFNNELQATIADTPYTEKERTLIFNHTGQDLWEKINQHGKTPLPPYIKNKKNAHQNYQTVFANNKKYGSAAAPTAGLHFTKDLLEKIKHKGIDIEFTTLHVGLGTFEPVFETNIKNHHMHSEYYEMDKKTYEKLQNAKENQQNIIAVGTTSMRVLETVFKDKKPKLSGETNIFIYPPYTFNITSELITNFHIPKSTLLMLVAAFMGTDHMKQAYNHALQHHYRFLSYGDAMYIKKS